MAPTPGASLEYPNVSTSPESAFFKPSSPNYRILFYVSITSWRWRVFKSLNLVSKASFFSYYVFWRQRTNSFSLPRSGGQKQSLFTYCVTKCDWDSTILVNLFSQICHDLIHTVDLLVDLGSKSCMISLSSYFFFLRQIREWLLLESGYMVYIDDLCGRKFTYHVFNRA